VVLLEGGSVRDQLAVHVYQEVVPVGIHTDERCAFDVKLKQGLEVVVGLPEQRVVCVYFVHLQHLRLSAVQSFSIELDSPSGTIWSLQLTEQAKRLLLNYLALELVDELAEGTELFKLVPHNFNELLAVQHKTYPVRLKSTYSLS